MLHVGHAPQLVMGLGADALTRVKDHELVDGDEIKMMFFVLSIS
jgi:hypothetical protein